MTLRKIIAEDGVIPSWYGVALRDTSGLICYPIGVNYIVRWSYSFLVRLKYPKIVFNRFEKMRWEAYQEGLYAPQNKDIRNRVSNEVSRHIVNAVNDHLAHHNMVEHYGFGVLEEPDGSTLIYMRAYPPDPNLIQYKAETNTGLN